MHGTSTDSKVATILPPSDP